MYTNEIKNKFIECYSFQQMKLENITTELKMTYFDIQQLYKQCKTETDEIQKVRNKFTNKRAEDNNNDFKEFYQWYKTQEQQCGYCGITQENLYKLFNKDKRVLPYLDNERTYKKAPKRSSGTLEIERLDSSGNYEKKNLILACPLCNNAKSNLIDEKNWREIFVLAMQKYYSKLLSEISHK